LRAVLLFHGSNACHTFAIAKTWQRSLGLKEAGIVDRPDTNSEIRTEGNVRYTRIQALAPSNRPVQVTENLALFWRETYPKLKLQLQRKYPKHEWR
jgi:HrpA-like RNA helicase